MALGWGKKLVGKRLSRMSAMCPSLQSSRSLVSTLIGRLFSGNENFIRMKCFKVLIRSGKFVMIFSDSWISNGRSKIRIFAFSLPDKLLSSSCIPFILSFRLSSWLWIAMAGFPLGISQDSRAESYCCNCSIDYFEHCEYTHIIAWIPMRLILLLFWSYQFKNVLASSRESAAVKNKAFDRSFFSKTKSVFLVMLLSKRI